MDGLDQQLEDWPGLAFAFTGGIFSLLYVLIRPVGDIASFFGIDRPSLFAAILIVGSSISALLVGTLLWNRFGGDASTSTYRPALLGALVGTLSMPLTLLSVTFSRYLFTGLPENLVFGSPPPGMTQWTPVGDLLLENVGIALFTSLFGYVFTAGLPILLGAATGEALRRITLRKGAAPHTQ